MAASGTGEKSLRLPLKSCLASHQICSSPGICILHSPQSQLRSIQGDERTFCDDICQFEILQKTKLLRLEFWETSKDASRIKRNAPIARYYTNLSPDQLPPRRLQYKTCPTCAIIRRAIVLAYPELRTESVRLGIQLKNNQKSRSTLKPLKRLALRASDEWTGLIIVYLGDQNPVIRDGQELCWGLEVNIRDYFKDELKQYVDKEPLSVNALGLMRSWIDDCLSSHSPCGAQRYVRLPRRLIHTGTWDTTPVLIETGPGDFGAYVTLSHCWGRSQPLQTTRATLEQHTSGIPWLSLPRTFQDAITVTRRLGYTYLWIDSLCIIQDDDADWRYHVSQMSGIYCQSILTIAASSSENSEAGFLIERPECHVLVDDPALIGCYRSLVMHVPTRKVHCGGRDNCKLHTAGDPAKLPLESRAWVFQERMLAARTLHFTRYEVKFECNWSTRCECDCIKGNYDGTSETLKSNFHHITGSRSHLWARIIESYTALDLTFETDRLPALAGIARTFNSGGSDVYIAGSWKSDIIKSLLWSCQGPPSGEYVAPTFLWSSKTGPVSFIWGAYIKEDAISPLIEVLNFTWEYENSDELGCYGPLRHGRLRVRATLVPASVFKRDNWPRIGQVCKDIHILTRNGQTVPHITCLDSPESFLPTHTRCIACTDHYLGGDTFSGPRQSHVVLSESGDPTAMYYFMPVEKARNCGIAGLLLKETTSLGTFIRVGFINDIYMDWETSGIIDLKEFDIV